MDEQEILERLRASRTGRKWRGRSCLAEKEISAYVEGGIESERRRRIEKHLADCHFCLGELSLASRLRERPDPEVPEALIARARALPTSHTPSSAHVFWQWPMRWSTALATSLLVIALGVWLGIPRSGPETDGGLGSGSDGMVRRLSQSPDPLVLTPKAGSVLSPSEIEFQWQEVPRTLYYEVSVVSLNGDLVWSGRAEDTQLRLSSGIALDPGAKYFIWVEAFLPEGKALRSSATPFEISMEP